MRRPRIFSHHIYELKKGLRHLILFTTTEEHRAAVVEKLEKNDIPYLIQEVSPSSNKINVFFGDQTCLDVLLSFGKSTLADINADEDFILGIMLGYDRIKQCERYLRERERQNPARVSDDEGDDLELVDEL